MSDQIDSEAVRALAELNGLEIPDRDIDQVRASLVAALQTLSRLDSFDTTGEAPDPLGSARW